MSSSPNGRTASALYRERTMVDGGCPRRAFCHPSSSCVVPTSFDMLAEAGICFTSRFPFARSDHSERNRPPRGHTAFLFFGPSPPEVAGGYPEDIIRETQCPFSCSRLSSMRREGKIEPSPFSSVITSISYPGFYIEWLLRDGGGGCPPGLPDLRRSLPPSIFGRRLGQRDRTWQLQP